MDAREKIEEIKKRVQEGLYFSRVPKKTRKEFIAWAKEEFCDDRGMAMKFAYEQCKEYQKIKKLLFSDGFLSSLKKNAENL